MRSSVLLAIAALALLTIPAAADSAAPAATDTATSTTAVDPDQIVCRAGAPVTGSRIPSGRQCMTNRQWAEMKRKAQEDLEISQRSGLQTTLPDR
jgi:hypothetical protein